MKVVIVLPLDTFEELRKAIPKRYSDKNNSNSDGTLIYCTINHKDPVTQDIIDWLSEREEITYVYSVQEWYDNMKSLGFEGPRY